MSHQIQLKQYVPSHICLKCEGCCRYETDDSMWRPKWDKRQFVDSQDYVTTIVECGKHLCRFLNKGDNTCKVYDDRPFECVLYPFVLSQTPEGLHVYVHLACPYIQDTQAGPALEAYKEYLRTFFQSADMIDFLKRSRHLIHDYTPALLELQHVFTLQAII